MLLNNSKNGKYLINLPCEYIIYLFPSYRIGIFIEHICSALK